jgi:RHH-type proline utilization regulon transcriptional repressor/proline dehydrogenase/delta 1-pyrroline-5-carboxylate dehydrogenase
MSVALTPTLSTSLLREAISASTRTPEPELLPGLIEQARLADAQAQAAQALALRVAGGVRERTRSAGRAGLVQELLQEFALSSQEGVALMCLAEALLRIPDAATRDALIRDKIGTSNWQAHLGQSPSLFVNAATWGLLLTGKLVATHSEPSLNATLRKIVGRGGEPLIRKGIDMAMRMMGEQFVTGESIEKALANARSREAEGFRYSYDMLGEAAMTARDAQAYAAAYEHAIRAIGGSAAARGRHGVVPGPIRSPGISIKLSALHPRYSRAKVERVMAELYPRLFALVQLARHYDIGLNIDAEESDRLELSLDLLERLCFEPALAGWHGIGFVVQAYQKRCPAVVEWLADLARRSGHCLMIRLVKGAYWDSEIKRAQLDGLDDYPVYTRKAHTDVAYIACARKLLAAGDSVYPQFATHNAHTLAAVQSLAAGRADDAYEFQCLHGMGEPLYEQVVGSVAAGGLGRACRIYAPVGTHETLLAYLVRRLLENGANTSFVNRIADETLPLTELVEDPVTTVQRAATQEGTLGLPHPAIPLPRALFGAGRTNSRGVDLASESVLASLSRVLVAAPVSQWHAAPMLGIDLADGAARNVHNPADGGDVVGTVRDATEADVEAALSGAAHAAARWAATPPADRAALLEAAAQRFEDETEALMALMVREAGKTYANAVSEVREAVDFLRYYAAQVRSGFDNTSHRPLGPVVCISPWNFPLAIFTGQVAAALAAGNVVLAKPAEQTPLVAAAAVRALWAAGVPRAAVQLLPGPGETVGAALVADARVQGVLFTGSTEVARLLQRALSTRLGAHRQPVPLIAETGGQNAMIVDSSALAEQVVADVVASAFDSAGQRCSALRVLCVQRDGSDRLIEMLEGAMRELRVGDPRSLAVDVGPVIDADAQGIIERHIAAMRAKGHRVARPASVDAEALGRGTFVPPALIQIGSIAELQREVFGPVLHVLRYERGELAGLLQQINATGYGLTLGVHTRIDETLAQVVQAAHAGNLYANRTIVGAVVGVQPFGGEGLSGTGPKAGGPLYLLRLLAERPADAAMRAVLAAGSEGEAPLRSVSAPPMRSALASAEEQARREAQQAFAAWAQARSAAHTSARIASASSHLAAQSPTSAWRTLRGPTGEANLYAVLPREAVLCLAAEEDDLLLQLAAVLAVGAHALWPAESRTLWERLPTAVRGRIALAQDWRADAVHFDAVLHHGSAQTASEIAQTLARRPGPIVGLTTLTPGDANVPLERLVIERSLSINTAAAGGNASLMSIG